MGISKLRFRACAPICLTPLALASRGLLRHARGVTRLDKIVSRNRAANRKQTRTLVLVAVGAGLVALVITLVALGIGLPPAPARGHRIDDIQLRRAPTAPASAR